MNTTTQGPGPRSLWLSRLRFHLPTVPEALASLLRTVVVALFLLTFVLQPYLDVYKRQAMDIMWAIFFCRRWRCA